MNRLLLLCILIAILGAVYRLIVASMGSDTLAKAFGIVMNLVIAATVIGMLGGQGGTLPQVVLENNADYFQSLSDSMMEMVYTDAETKLEQEILSDLKKEFGLEAPGCTITLDRETLELTTIRIDLATEDMLVSTYAVKQFLKEKYGVRAEVYIFDYFF